MFFKTLTAYRLDPDWLTACPPLAAQLAEHPLPQIPATAIECRGWHPLVREVAGAQQFVMLRDFRALPAAAVRRIVDERIAELEAQQNFRASRKQIRRLKEETIARLTPQVPVQRGEVHAVLDRHAGWLLLNTASSARADELTRTLRQALGKLPLKQLLPGQPMASLMTCWLAAGATPDPFALDDECQLVSRDAQKATVRYARHDLANDGVVDHLREGKLATRLAMTWRRRIAFVIDENMVLRRLRFLDEVEILENRNAENADDAETADLALMIGTLREFLADLAALTGAPIA